MFIVYSPGAEILHCYGCKLISQRRSLHGWIYSAILLLFVASITSYSDEQALVGSLFNWGRNNE
ncbi:hypothetical protein [Nostoc sp. MG11]|uniref:hypothetical protein n=1 Tax=Nostoc sp. MG11 TaxID=2721166 RepID=UPI0018695E44|nr:hypothetical protein [Nostoc sp. MG11]